MFKGLHRKITIFVFLSMLIHVFSWLGLISAPNRAPSRSHELVEIEFKSPDKPVDQVKDHQQIVDSQEQMNDQIDDKAKFLSATSQKVEKQTRARANDKFHNATQSGKKSTQAAASPQPEEEPVDESPSPKSGKPTLASLKPLFKIQPPQVQQPGDEGQSDLPSSTDDHLKDVEIGMQTMLSTREFVYFSYYSRIKERIRQHWEPTIRSKVKMIFRQGRTIASAKDHVTQVVIVLNPAGELVRVEVVSPSGIELLDDAAVEAFRAAQPFPNPPKGLVDEDGTIKIRWDFVLEASSYFQPQIKPEFARFEE